jgi:hypothetical protein
LLTTTDRFLCVVLAALLAGTALAFGGAVWWAGTMMAALSFLFALACLLRIALEGRMRLLKSPLAPLGFLALGLALVQLAPMPPALARKLSPRSQEVYSLGLFADRAQALDPGFAPPDGAQSRSPITLDRAATLRWVIGALVCLGVFWGVSQFTDRLQRLYLIWGSVIAAFFFNTAFAIVQLLGHTSGLYGLYEPGKGPFWAPSTNDLMSAPNSLVLRTLPGPSPAHPPWALLMPDRPVLLGTLMGGPGAYLALGSVALPLALALVLQLVAPRGSRELLAMRLRNSGQGGLVVLLAVLLIASAVLVGILAGPLLSVPFALALVLVGLPSAWPSGLRWGAIGATVLALAGLGIGVAGGQVLRRVPGALPTFRVESILTEPKAWSDALAIVRDFPVFGSGLGSFASVYPFYKSHDATRTTALSSLLQWWVESGAVGVSLLLSGVLWSLYRLPGAVRRTGTADRALVFGLIGAAVGFSLYATVHWTVELAAVAIAVSALAGACNRWLSGGTDLFVERG